MKIQLAYRFTGENREETRTLLSDIKKLIEDKGHSVWVPELDPDKPSSKKDLFFKTFDKINEIDILLVILKSDDKSEGMLMEIGCAISKNKRIWLLVNKKVVSTHIREVADKIIEFDNLNDLMTEINSLKW